MKTAVDSNVLFDLLVGDSSTSAWASQALSRAASVGPIIICPVVYAELAAGFGNPKDLLQFLHDLQLHVEDFSRDALFEAASAWKRYATRRSNQVQCPNCGQKSDFCCPKCQEPLAWRQHMIADFLVGGHALSQAGSLITRDRGYFRTYFPNLKLISPPPKDS